MSTPGIIDDNIPAPRSVADRKDAEALRQRPERELSPTFIRQGREATARHQAWRRTQVDGPGYVRVKG